MSRDILKTLQLQEQMYRQMGNSAQGNILDRTQKEIIALREAVQACQQVIQSEIIDNPNVETTATALTANALAIGTMVPK